MNIDFANLVIDTPGKLLYFIDAIVIGLSLLAVVIAVYIDFAEFHKRGGVKREKKSIVETGTMFLFFFLFYFFTKFNIGQIRLEFNSIFVVVNVLCLAVVVLGAFVNVKGRFNLGKNWSNQIKIYRDHTFVSKGMYSIVRHPLYASLIWMFLAASVIYLNYLAFFATLLIFIPFMYYRAKQEEALLLAEFNNYKEYQKKVWMFFPKVL